MPADFHTITGCDWVRALRAARARRNTQHERLNKNMKIKLIENGQAPTRANANDAGLDCHARETAVIGAGYTVKIPLGFAVQLPDGFEMQIRGRSSLSARGLLCHLGTVDAGYRGEVAAIVTNLTHYPVTIGAGQRVAQAVIARVFLASLPVVAELDASERGAGGFGSTDAKCANSL